MLIQGQRRSYRRPYYYYLACTLTLEPMLVSQLAIKRQALPTLVALIHKATRQGIWDWHCRILIWQIQILPGIHGIAGILSAVLGFPSHRCPIDIFKMSLMSFYISTRYTPTE
jgi:hypothetical protein